MKMRIRDLSRESKLVFFFHFITFSLYLLVIILIIVVCGEEVDTSVVSVQL